MGEWLLLGGAAVSFFVGAALIEVGFEVQAGNIWGLVAVCFCGGIFIVFAGLLGMMFRDAYKDSKAEAAKKAGEEAPGPKKSKWQQLKELLSPDYSAPPDSTDTERRLTQFRQNLALFFKEKGRKENDPIQGDATQIEWNMLELQKQRLENLKVNLDIEMERRSYGDESPVRVYSYFDGRYEVKEVEEEIAAKRRYSVGGRVCCTETNNQLAHYTMLAARQQGKDKIVCPNCGNVTTRDNLIDGCDYCGTKFTVEDIGLKVSDYGLRTSLAVQYAKYERIRALMKLWVNLLIGVPVFIFSLTGMLYAAMDEGLGAGPFMTVTAVILGTAFCTFAFCYLGNIAFWAGIFPLIQMVASGAYWGSKYMESLKKSAADDSSAERQARHFDELFSLKGFFSNVQNKLAAIHYADTPTQINAFALCDLKDKLPGYSRIVAMDVAEIKLSSFSVSDGMQSAEVLAELKLLEKNGESISKRSEKVRLLLAKSAKAKTKAAGTPSVLRCKGCGASISLLEGKKCSYCGSELDLPQHDWAIVKYSNM